MGTEKILGAGKKFWALEKVSTPGYLKKWNDRLPYHKVKIYDRGQRCRMLPFYGGIFG